MPKAKVNGINIGYDIDGQGEPLVLIMGLGATRLGWIFQKRAFRKHFQVITFDNRGVGGSDKPSGPYTMRAMADDTIGLMDHLGVDKAHILGLSMGGMITQELAINYPERVRKLVLASTIARMNETDREQGLKELQDIGIRKVLTTKMALAFNKRLYRMVFYPLIILQVTLTRTTHGLLGQMEAVFGHDTVDRLQMIGVPTLVIAGTEDRTLAPSYSDALADGIPNSKLVKVEGGSHVLGIEMRGRFNKEVLDFLSGD